MVIVVRYKIVTQKYVLRVEINLYFDIFKAFVKTDSCSKFDIILKNCFPSCVRNMFYVTLWSSGKYMTNKYFDIFKAFDQINPNLLA